MTASISGVILRIVNGHEKKKRETKQTESSSVDDRRENYTDSDDGVVESKRVNEEARENYPDLDNKSSYTVDSREDTGPYFDCLKYQLS